MDCRELVEIIDFSIMFNWLAFQRSSFKDMESLLLQMSLFLEDFVMGNMNIEESIIPSFPGAAIVMLGQIVPITCLLPVIFGRIFNGVKVLIQGVGIGRFYFTSNINSVLSQYFT